ncbi:hypothetical protein B0H15DRAFT_810726 [Mycena belliarum]|uniref:Polyketide synthase-like phosphopantetheine-binding domain-containing protein n=1 Tax=Mycena belliarum TaxID=1033014 RepID=A0AAD6UNQ3_9AGAR|nr:hypothetical protein B0H15DRAFT_810726 [Mycena belliae]
MHFSTLQAQNSPTFSQPPLDGSLLLPEIFDHHAQHSPNHPLFRYAPAGGTVQTISWSHAVRAFHRAAQIVCQRVKVVGRPVIGIVASSDQITYFSLIAGILRAGFQAFPISPRNSDVAIAHLLRSIKCTHVFVSADAAMQKLVGGASTRLEGELEVIPMPSFEDLFAGSSHTELLPPMQKISLDAPAIILHSSGSTAFPKTIPLTYRILTQSGLIPSYGHIDLCGHVLSAHAVPMFHLMGVIQLPWTAFTGLTLSLLPPTSPPTVPTPERVFTGALATNSTLMFCVPAFLESWAREPDRLTALKNFRTVIFAGGPLQPSVGDMLAQNGVKIAHLYGLTESSCLTIFLPDAPPKEGWDYFYFSPHIDPVFLPVEDIPGVYHLVIKKCKTHTPAVLNTTVDGVEALNTNDLFLRHPSNPNLWKVFGRLDDQIMHSTGEKTNPGPLEAIILKNPAIKYAVMFGRGNFHAGVILFPAEPFDPADTERVIQFRRSIWPVVEEANQFAPTHSRIFKEMILVADPSKPIELTAKGTPRRQAVLNTYDPEIRSVYAAVEESSQTHLTAPDTYAAQGSLNFVRHVVSKVMREMPGDDDDIFQHGCDSLQATWIRNSILHALRKSGRVDMKAVPHNFVYSCPTVRLLADLLTQLASGSGSTSSNLVHQAEVMQGMMQKYTQEFPDHHTTSEAPNTEVVLVTGTTGVFGSQILAHLLVLPEVSLVYALNRPSSGSSMHHRQLTSFDANGIDMHLLESPKLKLLEGDLNLLNFGLPVDNFTDIRKNVTSIIHNAWQVNFNFTLASMEPLVSGTRRLTDFALASPHPAPPRFIFVSSAGIFRNLKSPTALEQHISDPQIAAGSGYSESKWVAEEILNKAAGKTGLLPIIIRPGQLSGASNGAWNPSDWFPVLIRASQILGHLPSIFGHISWVPIDHAARALVNMRNSNERYLHITHPRPISITDILSRLSKVLELPLVPYSTWLESLEAAALLESTAPANPGVHLIEFFRSYQEVSAEQEVLLSAVLSNTRAVEATESLASLEPLTAEDADKWVAYLRNGGHLS